MKKEKELNILEPNKTVVFTTPISLKNTCLVRTGVINNDNSSLLHSILLSYSKDYFYMDNKNRVKILNKLKINIFDKEKFDVDNFLNFKNRFFEVFEIFYNHITNNEEIKDKNIEKIVKNICNNELHDIICELIPLEDFKNISLVKDEKIFFNVEPFLDNLDILKYIEKEKSEYIKKNIKQIINNVIIEIEKDEYKIYLDNILKDTDSINKISKCLKLNIYFIDYKTRLPFLFSSNQSFKNNKSIIVLKLENTYENIGLLLEENKVQREFKLEKDEIIKKIHTFLLFPEKINKKYPELVSYLPINVVSKEIKKISLKDYKIDKDGNIHDDNIHDDNINDNNIDED